MDKNIDDLYYLDFDNQQLGIYTIEQLEKDWGQVKDNWLNGIYEERVRIVEDDLFLGQSSGRKKRVLECKYPARKFCPQKGGVQWKASIKPKNEYFLEYKVKFKKNFEWVKGGKLPGLAGGSTPTGGHVKKDGFSSRYMWRADGVYELYLYWSGQSDKYGDMIRPGCDFKKGVWHNLKQYISLNTPGQENGAIKLWFDGEEIYSRQNFKFRLKEASWQIDYFLFSTFYGGNSMDWAPENDNFIKFTDFRIY